MIWLKAKSVLFKMVKKNFFNSIRLPKTAFYLSLITPLVLILSAFGVSFFNWIFLTLVIVSTIVSLTFGIISLVKISKKKIKGGLVYGIISVVFSGLFLFLWVIAFFAAMQYISQIAGY